MKLFGKEQLRRQKRAPLVPFFRPESIEEMKFVLSVAVIAGVFSAPGTIPAAAQTTIPAGVPLRIKWITAAACDRGCASKVI